MICIEDITKILEEKNPKAVQDYLDGQKASLNFLVGQVMRLTRGKADPGETVKLLRENIE